MAPTSTDSKATAATKDAVLKYKEILKSNGINAPVSEVLFSDSGLKGENLSSETEYVTILFENPSQKPLHLFVKKNDFDPESIHGQMIAEAGTFPTETMFYMEYLAEARKHCESKKQGDLMKMYSKCYYGDERSLVFENLVLGKGYTLLDKLKKQDFEAASFAITNLAKHHAISYAMIKKYNGISSFYERFTHFKNDPFFGKGAEACCVPATENGILTTLQLLETSGLEYDSKITETLKSFQGKAFGHMKELIVKKSGKLNVLNHGDYWNNNMMFLKEKDTGKLIDCIVVDFQVARYGSFCLDLGYFLFTSVQGEIRRKKLNEIFELYLNTFKLTSNALGNPVDITLEELQQEFREYFQFGFYMGVLFLSEACFSILKDMDLHKITNMADWANEFTKLIREWIDAHPERCKDMAKDVIDVMQEFERYSKGIFVEN